MDIPIHVKFPENIQENEINNINNESNIKYDEFYQVKYENSLKESQKIYIINKKMEILLVQIVVVEKIKLNICISF